MKFDATVKELQKEKTDLEAKLKQVNVAIAALAKLGGKQSAAALGQAAAGTGTAQPVTAAKPATPQAQPASKPFGS
jgi:hypothetical protein